MRISLPDVTSQILKDQGVKLEESKNPDPEKPPEENYDVKWTGARASNFDAPEGLHSAASIWWYNFMRWIWGKPNKFGRFVKGKGWKVIGVGTATIILIVIASRSPAEVYMDVVFFLALATGFIFRWATSHKRSFGAVKRERAGLKVARARKLEDGDFKYVYTTQEYNRTTVYDIPEEAFDYFIWIDVIMNESSNGTKTPEFSECIGNIAWGEGRYKELGNSRVDEVAKTVTLIPDDPNRVIEAFNYMADQDNYPEDVRKKVRAMIHDMYTWAEGIDDADKTITRIAGRRLITVTRPSKEAKFFIDTLSVQSQRILDKVNEARDKVADNPDETIDLVNEARAVLVEKSDLERRIRYAEKRMKAKTEATMIDLTTNKPEMAVKSRLSSDLPIEERAVRTASYTQERTLEDELADILDNKED